MSRSDQAFHTHTAVELVHLEFKSESRGGLVAERSCPHLSLGVRKLTGPFHSEAEKIRTSQRMEIWSTTLNSCTSHDVIYLEQLINVYDFKMYFDLLHVIVSKRYFNLIVKRFYLSVFLYVDSRCF